MRTLAAILGIAVLIATMPADARAATSADPHACCKKHQRSQMPAKKSNCPSGQCSLQCCRIMPVPAESAPKLVSCGTVVAELVLSPTQLNSLTDPDPPFHPPRA